ncbi:MAG: hypothetical protein LBE31_03260, partial [Deltaproteobacteria bacterium]|nr:hypothetical protein [Deltaproteobacteria bacterium]
RVLRIIGQKRSLLALSAAGFGLSLDKEYGDSLVLGGAETTLLELVGAYGALATGGNYVKPLFFLPATSDPANDNSKQQRLWDSAPVWLINESLRDDSRLPVGLRGDSIAFKTGTSHGLRDAWFVAYTPSYTLALWAGDSSGRSHEGLTGLKLLAPTAVSLMRALGPAPDWPGPPEGLERYKACPISGEPVSPNCPSFKWAWRLSAKATTSPCTLHVRRGGQIVTLWPPELFDYMTRTPQAKTALPKPVIVSPPDGAIIRLGYGAERLPLKSEGTVGDVYWYVDDAFLTKSSVGTTPVIALTIGSHRVSLLDARGLTSKSEFKVLAPKSESAGVLTVKR